MILSTRAAGLTVAAISVLALGAAATPALAAGSTTLKDRVERTEQAGGKDDFDLSLPGQYWAAVALRPGAGVKTSMKLFAEPARESVLAKSAKKGSAINFVAMDASAFPTASFYPTVKSAGAGSYVIELDKGSLQMLELGEEISFTMGTKDVVRTVSIVAQHAPGATYEVTLVPSDGDQDGAVHVMENAFGLENPHLGSKEAVASADSKGPGGTERLTFVGGNSQSEYGIVVTNRSGSGSYTLTMALAD